MVNPRTMGVDRKENRLRCADKSVNERREVKKGKKNKGVFYVDFTS